MNLRAVDLPPELAPFPPSLFTDPVVRDRLGGSCGNTAELLRVIESFDRLTPPRAELARRLREDNARWGASTTTLDHCGSVAEPSTLCVVSGQQPGFLTGPLYSVLKIVTTIALARRLTAQTHRPFVPVFWIASDDHDLAEMDSCSLVAADGALKRFRLPLGSLLTSASRIALPPSVADVITEVLVAIGSEPSATLRAALAPRPGDRFVDSFARLVHHLFANTGLVLFEPRSFADLSAAFLTRHLDDPSRVPDALRAGAAKLREHGRAAPLREDLSSCVFVLEAERRRRFDPATHVRAAIDERLRTDPSSVTPDAALRPLLQSTLLPAPVFVGGPGELAYWMQLREAFESAALPQPLFAPRFNASFLEPKIRRALEAGGIAPAAALAIAPADPVPPRDANIDAAAGRLLAEFESFARALPSTSGNVAKKLDEFRRAFSSSVAKLATLAAREIDQNAANAHKRAMLVAAHLRPNGQLQERVVNALPFALRYGEDLFVRIAESIDPFDPRHAFVDLVPSGASDA